MTKILVIDEGTSSTRATIYNKNLERGDFCQIEIPLLSPSPDIVEQDANLIFAKSLEMAKAAMNGEKIDAIGITNQRETTILWDKATGEPIHNALIWQDRRGADFCDALKQNGKENLLTQKTGLLADPYFSGFKIRWLLQNIDGLRARAQNGEILFGTIDCWIIWKLTGGKSHVTDFSNASRTAIFNIHNGEWDDELLALFEIPRALLPKVQASNSDFGYCEILGAKITGVLGDQQAALMGQNCTKAGEAKITFGTGAFLMVQTEEKAQSSSNKMLTTVASKIDDKINYAIEGAVLNAGTAIKWLRDELEIIDNSSDSEAIAKLLDNNNGVYFVPAFTGLGAPYWDANARGTICGIGRGTNKAHIIRAALEASAYQTYDLLEAIKKDGIDLNVLRIDGGMSANNFFCQFLADICNIKVERPKDLEMTAMGAARIALFGLENTFSQKPIPVVSFAPNMDIETREGNLKGWQRAIKATLTL